MLHPIQHRTLGVYVHSIYQKSLYTSILIYHLKQLKTVGKILFKMARGGS